MTIHRDYRREVADNLAAFMRSEITNKQYLHLGFKQTQIDDNKDITARNWCCVCWWHPKAEEHFISVQLDVWEHMCRVLAFLETDMEMSSIPPADRMPLKHVKKIDDFTGFFKAIGTTIVLSVLYGLSFGINFGLFIVAWIGFGVSALIIGGKRNAERLQKRSQDINSYAPFSDKEQWEAHRHLLARFNLPIYDPNIHNKPLKPMKLTFREYGVQFVTSAPLVIGFLIIFCIAAPIVGLFQFMQVSDET